MLNNVTLATPHPSPTLHPGAEPRPHPGVGGDGTSVAFAGIAARKCE